MKKCSKCGETKELTEFFKEKSAKDGHRGDCKICNYASVKAYKAANRERVLEGQRQWREANSEYRAEMMREWKQANFLKHREHRARERAKKHGAPIGHADYELVVATSNGLCGICGDPIFGKFDIDHIVPLTKGGAHSTDNLQVAHHHCNVSKGNRKEAA